MFQVLPVAAHQAGHAAGPQALLFARVELRVVRRGETLEVGKNRGRDPDPADADHGATNTADHLRRWRGQAGAACAGVALVGSDGHRPQRRGQALHRLG
jgi:hypothetical protein